MKKLFLTLLFLVAISDLASAQTQKRGWPFGCRKHTFGFNIGVLAYSTEITLCCIPANWKSPPISCTEIENNRFSQYIMVAEIESIIKAEVKETTIEFAETTISEDDRSFILKKGSYPIEVNEKNERFVKVIFEKNN